LSVIAVKGRGEFSIHAATNVDLGVLCEIFLVPFLFSFSNGQVWKKKNKQEGPEHHHV